MAEELTEEEIERRVEICMTEFYTAFAHEVGLIARFNEIKEEYDEAVEFMNDFESEDWEESDIVTQLDLDDNEAENVFKFIRQRLYGDGNDSNITLPSFD